MKRVQYGLKGAIAGMGVVAVFMGIIGGFFTLPDMGIDVVSLTGAAIGTLVGIMSS